MNPALKDGECLGRGIYPSQKNGVSGTLMKKMGVFFAGLCLELRPTTTLLLIFQKLVANGRKVVGRGHTVFLVLHTQ